MGDGNSMKITRMLPKRLAIEWQQYDIRNLETKLEYYQQMTYGIRQLLEEAYAELQRLQRG